MKRTTILLSILAITLTVFAITPPTGKLVSSKTHIKFFSTTPAEDIEANNYASVSTLNTETGGIIFSVPMQSFEFEKALMQKHFNDEKFLDTKEFPKAKIKAKIINLSEIDFSKDGTYETIIEGELTIKGVTKNVKEKGSITISGNSVSVKSTFNITLADYNVTFVKGKPSKNIAKTVEITVHAEYQGEE